MSKQEGPAEWLDTSSDICVVTDSTETEETTSQLSSAPPTPTTTAFDTETGIPATQMGNVVKTASTTTAETGGENAVRTPLRRTPSERANVDIEWFNHITKYKKVLGASFDAETLREWEDSVTELKRLTLGYSPKNYQIPNISRAEEDLGNVPRPESLLEALPGLECEILAPDYDCLLIFNDPEEIDPGPAGKLGLGGDAIVYLTSRSILTTASPVFGRELQPYKFPEGAIDGCRVPQIFSPHKIKWYINLPYAGRHLRIVMRIIHFCAKEADLTIDWEPLIWVANFCEAYKLQAALSIWSNAWIGKYSKNILDLAFADWLYISDVFEASVLSTGASKGVDNLIKRLADKGYPDDINQDASNESVLGDYILVDLRVGGGEKLIEMNGCNAYKVLTLLWPRNKYRRIMSLRRRKIKHLINLLKAVESILKPYSNQYLGGRKICNSQTCLNLAYGSFIGRIQKYELSDVVIKGVWTKSAATLREAMGKITVDTLGSIYKGHLCLIPKIQDKYMTYIKSEVVEHRDSEDVEEGFKLMVEKSSKVYLRHPDGLEAVSRFA